MRKKFNTIIKFLVAGLCTTSLLSSYVQAEEGLEGEQFSNEETVELIESTEMENEEVNSETDDEFSLEEEIEEESLEDALQSEKDSESEITSQAQSDIDVVSTASRTLPVSSSRINLDQEVIDDKTDTISGLIEYVGIVERMPPEAEIYDESQIINAIVAQGIELWADGIFVKKVSFSGTLFFKFALAEPFVGGTNLTIRIPLIEIKSGPNDLHPSYVQFEDLTIIVEGEPPTPTGELKFAGNGVPSNFSFIPISFSYESNNISIQQAFPFNIGILDSRNTEDGWKLNAKLLSETNFNGNLYFDAQQLTTENAVLIATSPPNSEELTNLVIGGESPGFELNLNPSNNPPGTYALTIVWQLTDGP